MIIITGAAGFIGSCLVQYLNLQGERNLILVDQFNRSDKNKNLRGKTYLKKIERDVFLDWFRQHTNDISLVLHIGARTDTTENRKSVFDNLNLNYSKAIAEVCIGADIPLIYASSAATYGIGNKGFNDSLSPESLKPLNPYGNSKNDFDKWMLKQKKQPVFWAGLKFFNVYGPNEYHKGRMASVILHTFKQIQQSGQMNLFRSHRPDYKDGHQSRDFIYIKDLLSVIDFLLQKRPLSGLYNLGTGKARSFLDLAENTFIAMGIKPKIGFIDTPIDIRDNYQYFTEAKMDKLQLAGYTKDFYSLEDGIKDYVQNYLMKDFAYY
ncbi:MAG: ADP-glyceromanno-heptose 6-epimerase [Saprospiraceae bacterium]|nr:ADP-glyceromanno-heptose 6-epimerase [Saprospiraceae bacterium]